MLLCQLLNTKMGKISLVIEIILSAYILYLQYKQLRDQLNKSERENFDILLLFISIFYLLSNIYSLAISESFLIDTLSNLFIFLLVLVISCSLLFQYLIKKENKTIKYFKYTIYFISSLLLFLLIWFLIKLIKNNTYSQCDDNLNKTIVLLSFIICTISIGFIIYNLMKENINDNSFSMICDEYYHLNILLLKQFKQIQKAQRYYMFVLFSLFMSSFIEFFILFLYNPLSEENNSTIEINQPFCYFYSKVNNISQSIICFLNFFIKDILPALTINIILVVKPHSEIGSKAFIEMT